MKTHFETIIVGGGIGGLTAAASLARAGQRALLLERSEAFGGRGMTTVEAGHHLNVGGHALYLGGAAMRTLRALGVKVSGRTPRPVLTQRGLFEGEVLPLPAGPLDILGSPFLDWSERWACARAFMAMFTDRSGPLMGVPFSQWLDAHTRSPRVRALVEGVTRVSTYSNAPSRASAGAVLTQLRMGIRHDVLYLDGGWGAMVDALAEAASGAGATLKASAAVRSVAPQGEGWRVETDDAVLTAGSVVLAGGPQLALKVLKGPGAEALAPIAADLVPVRAACLDVALSRLPDPGFDFLLGLDTPMYFSVHSSVASLAPEGGAVLHAMKYLDPDEDTDPKADIEALEALIDLAQPGWRGAVVKRRALPRMTVTHAHVEARHGGPTGRPGVALVGAPGVYLVGDWVGPEGMLVDASFASAAEASARILASPRRQARLAA